MSLNYCPNCGAPLNGQQDQTDQADMPEDAAPDLPPENADPPMDKTLAEAQDLLESTGDSSPLVGRLGLIRSLTAELLDAQDKGESLDLPYYRETAFQLKKELDRLSPIAMVSRWKGGR